MRLILVRHAKSAWNNQALHDHDRPLAPRGIRAADDIGRWLAENDFQPSEVFCSTAARAQSTWEGIEKHVPEPEIYHLQPALYGASWIEKFMMLTEADSSPVAMIGHNPATANLAAAAVDYAPAHPQFGRYPTAATLVCDFPARSWADIRPGTARVVDFVVPRELKD